jgi:hypothetical protein
LIFDNSFQSSRFYFEVLQLLRLFSERIRETGRDLQATVRDENFFLYDGYVERSSFDNYQCNEIIRRNWEIVTKKQTTAENQLLARITEKTEALQSLRDGVLLPFPSFLYTSDIFLDNERNNSTRSVKSNNDESIYRRLYCRHSYVSTSELHWSTLYPPP